MAITFDRSSIRNTYSDGILRFKNGLLCFILNYIFLVSLFYLKFLCDLKSKIFSIKFAREKHSKI